MTGWPDRGRPVHADRPCPPLRRLAAVAAATVAGLAAVALGVASCLSAVEPSHGTPTSASPITLTPADGTARKSP